MSAQPRAEPEDRPVILRISRDKPPTRAAPSGYAMVPKYVTRHPHLTTGDKVVFDALIGLCYGHMTSTRAKIREIAVAAAVHPDTVRRAFVRLTRFGLICRRPDPDAIGSSWMTHILGHPRNLMSTGPSQNQGGKSSVQYGEQTIVNRCAIPTAKSSRPQRQKAGGATTFFRTDL